LLWLMFYIVNILFSFSSKTRYNVALLMQLTGFAWFIVTFNFYLQECSSALSGFARHTTDNIIIADTAGSSFSLLNFFIKAEQLLPYLSVAYLCLLIFLCIKWFKNITQVQTIKTKGLSKADVQWKLFIKKIALQLNIRHEIKIHLSSLVKKSTDHWVYKTGNSYSCGKHQPSYHRANGSCVIARNGTYKKGRLPY